MRKFDWIDGVLMFTLLIAIRFLMKGMFSRERRIGSWSADSSWENRGWTIVAVLVMLFGAMLGVMLGVICAPTVYSS